MALNAMQREMVRMRGHAPRGVIATPASEGDLFTWRATLTGPPDSFLEGREYHLMLFFPPNYPFSGPQMIFVEPLWHPNVAKDGTFCPHRQHAPSEPLWGILLGIMATLLDPDPEDCVCLDAAEMFLTNPGRYWARFLGAPDEDDPSKS